MAELILMVGNVGAGKTRLSQKLTDENTIHINLDSIAAQRESPSYIGITNIVNGKVFNGIDTNKKVILDGNFLTIKDRKLYSEYTRGCGGKVICYDFGAGTEQQLSKRIASSPHVLPKKWRELYAEKVSLYEKPTYKECIDEIWIVNEDYSLSKVDPGDKQPNGL